MTESVKDELIAALQTQVHALKEENLALRRESIRERVKAFHTAMGQPVLDKPTIPPVDRTRLRLNLIREEFFELLQSALFDHDDVLGSLEEQLTKLIRHDIVMVSLPQFADALADLAYVIEGTNLEFGVDGQAVLKQVHRANMLKLKGGFDEKGKVQKPADWSPPDIEGELRRQGW